MDQNIRASNEGIMPGGTGTLLPINAELAQREFAEAQQRYFAQAQQQYLAQAQQQYFAQAQQQYLAEAQQQYLAEAQQRYLAEAQQRYLAEAQQQFAEAQQQNFGEAQQQYLAEAHRQFLEAHQQYFAQVQQRSETVLFDVLKLHEAARNGSAESFKRVSEDVAAERKLSQKTIICGLLGLSGNSWLHVAVNSGNEEVAKYIATNFPFLNFYVNLKEDTALHVAARAGSLNMVEILVRPGFATISEMYANVDQLMILRNRQRYTALHEAALNRHFDVVTFLLAENQRGNTALHEAAMNKNFDDARSLLRNNPVFISNQAMQVLPILPIAVKNDDRQLLLFLLPIICEQYDVFVGFLQGIMPPAHVAISQGKIGVLDLMAMKCPELLKLRDATGQTALHLAAAKGELVAIRLLLNRWKESCFEADGDGWLPIHWASEGGQVEVVKELLKHWPDPNELLTRNKGHNILHLAAKFGQDNVVRYVLGNPKLGKLLNEKDSDGNTPLHLAAKYSQPSVVLTLTWDKRIELNLLNRQGLTPFDVFTKSQMKWFPYEMQTLQQSLTARALRAAGCKASWDPEKDKDYKEISEQLEEPKKIELIYEKVGILLTIATLVTTGSFAAGFTVPGGYNSSEHPNKGMPTLLHEQVFQFFMICNTTSFYCSIICILSCLYTKYADIVVAAKAYNLALAFFGFALAMMSLAFTAAIQLAVSKLSWLNYLILIIGATFVVLMFLAWILDTLQFWSPPLFKRYASYYISRLLIFLFLRNYPRT